MAWVTPPPFDLTEFDPAGFAAGSDTLYLLTKDSAGAPAPLVAAFADQVMVDATVMAERTAAGWTRRCWSSSTRRPTSAKSPTSPSCTPTSDPAASSPSPSSELPAGRRRVGRSGDGPLWAAATVKSSARARRRPVPEKVSRLVGEYDVAVRSVHHGQGSHGENLSLRRQRILAVEDLRQLPKGQALLLATGCRPALVTLRPWFAGPRAGDITVAYNETLAALTARANTGAGSRGAPHGGAGDKGGVSQASPTTGRPHDKRRRRFARRARGAAQPTGIVLRRPRAEPRPPLPRCRLLWRSAAAARASRADVSERGGVGGGLVRPDLRPPSRHRSLVRPVVAPRRGDRAARSAVALIGVLGLADPNLGMPARASAPRPSRAATSGAHGRRRTRPRREGAEHNPPPDLPVIAVPDGHWATKKEGSE